MTRKQTNKPVIEAMINTVALAVAASGVIMLQDKDVFGFGLIALAVGVEWFKYWGRRTYW